MINYSLSLLIGRRNKELKKKKKNNVIRDSRDGEAFVLSHKVASDGDNGGLSTLMRVS